MSLVLITGGCGFVGSHTCCVLLENGFNIIILDSLLNSSKLVLEKIKKLNQKNKTQIKFIKGDVRNEFLLENIFQYSINKGEKIDSVIHFAGLKSARESVTESINYWNVNLSSAIILLKVMEKYACFNFVFSSSASIYGVSQEETIKESSNINPISPYANTKAAIEILLKDVSISDKRWRIICLRYFNPIGAHPSGLIGECSKFEPTNVFPIIMKVASGMQNKLKIFGNDWETKDGTAIRDYVHVLDVAEAHYLALKRLISQNEQIIAFNIGTGKGASVLELVNTFEKVNKCKVPMLIVPRRHGDVKSLIANNDFSRKELNWNHRRNLEQMCEDGWKYYCKNNDFKI